MLKPRMAAGCPPLHDLEQADQDDEYGSGKQPLLRKRKADGEINQNEGEAWSPSWQSGECEQ